MEQKLLEKIYYLHKEYNELKPIVDKKNEEIKNLRNKNNDYDLQTAEKVLTFKYVDNIFYNRDLQHLFFKMVTLIELYIEIAEKDELPEEIKKQYSTLKQFIPKQAFVPKNGELVETEAGRLEEERKLFLESDFYKNLMAKVQ